MKNILKYFLACLTIGALVPAGFSSCTDMDGDGVDSVVWNGSVNPQSTSFRNPVWEPSLEAGTVVKGSSFAAISATTQWAPGLTYNCPTLTSQNLMDWKNSSDAFGEATLPAWASGRVNSLSVDYARTIANANFWMFYTIEGQNAIGAAYSPSTPQGPYNDLGQVTLKTNTSLVKDPFFAVVAKTSYYLCYTTEEGTYLQKMTLSRGKTPTCSGEPKLIAGPQVSDIAFERMAADKVYMFFTVNGEIRYARAENINGPYNDKNGKSVADGGTGEPLIAPNATFNAVENPMRTFLNTAGTHLYLAYNATLAEKPTMASGYARRPMFVQPLELADDGWIKGTYTPEVGWTSPKFE